MNDDKWLIDLAFELVVFVCVFLYVLNLFI